MSQELLKALVKWGRTHSFANLAAELGYRSSSSISQWILRGKIPYHQQERLRKILARKEIKN